MLDLQKPSVKNNSKPLELLRWNRDSFCDFAEFDFLPEAIEEFFEKLLMESLGL